MRLPTRAATSLARRLTAIAVVAVLATLAPHTMAAQNPPPGPHFVGGTFQYGGCDVSGGIPRSCTQLLLIYQFQWNPGRNGYEGGATERGTTQFFTPGAIDCERRPFGPNPDCTGLGGPFLVGSDSFEFGGCPECLWSGVPNPASLAPDQIVFHVAYGPEGVRYDPFQQIAPPGVTRVSYVLTKGTIVPEPGTTALTASGLFGLALLVRRRARA